MSEIEFDQVMEAVWKAIVLPVDDGLARSLVAAEPPTPTNDNVGPAWPIVPFPEGACIS